MSTYYVHFVDHGEHIYATERIRCRDDADAIATAHTIDFPNIGAGFEVWDGQRLVHREWHPAKLKRQA